MNKRILLLNALFWVLASLYAQKSVQTTISDGNFLSPLTWTCNCIPADTDALQINHHVVLNASWMANKRITINPGASLRKDAGARNFFLNKDSLFNYGVFEVDSFLVSPNAGVINQDSLIVNVSYWNMGTLNNSGKILRLDSLLNSNWFVNSGYVESGCYTNSAQYSNSGVQNTTYFLNTSYAHNTNTIQSAHLSNFGTFANDSIIQVSADMWNCGYLTNGSHASITVAVDFLNSDSSFTYFTNNGKITVGGNWTNDDTINGSGSICVHLWSFMSTTGAILGNQDFCDATTVSGIDLNQGYLAPTVSICSHPCSFAGIQEINKSSCKIYPNPFTDYITFEAVNPDFKGRLILYDALGHEIFQNTVSFTPTTIQHLSKGIYLYKIISGEGVESGKIIAQ